MIKELFILVQKTINKNTDRRVYMTELKMLTREDVAELFHSHVNTISMLREIGVIEGIKIGKNYMFPASIIVQFENDYLGLDCSNREKALESKRIVDAKKNAMVKGSEHS